MLIFNQLCVLIISIHALREEGDQILHGLYVDLCDFNPRPPRGGRLYEISHFILSQVISIHALREEGDFHSFCGM